MNRILLVMRKEWLEIMQQRVLVLALVIPPLLFALVPAIIGYFTGSGPVDDLDEMSGAFTQLYPNLAGLTTQELGQAIVGQMLSVMFLFLPVILPSVLASYSIVGEKTSQTLEPLLATPVKTWELLVAKCLAVLVPSVVITWVASLVYMGGIWVVAISPAVFWAIFSWGWILVLVLCSPLLALITVLLTVAVSSRANDPRTAQQVSVVTILPILGMFAGQALGLLAINPLFAMIATLGLLAISALVLWVTTRVFRRETILTRWS